MKSMLPVHRVAQAHILLQLSHLDIFSSPSKVRRLEWDMDELAALRSQTLLPHTQNSSFLSELVFLPLFTFTPETLY